MKKFQISEHLSFFGYPGDKKYLSERIHRIFAPLFARGAVSEERVRVAIEVFFAPVRGKDFILQGLFEAGIHPEVLLESIFEFYTGDGSQWLHCYEKTVYEKVFEYVHSLSYPASSLFRSEQIVSNEIFSDFSMKEKNLLVRELCFSICEKSLHGRIKFDPLLSEETACFCHSFTNENFFTNEKYLFFVCEIVNSAIKILLSNHEMKLKKVIKLKKLHLKELIKYFSINILVPNTQIPSTCEMHQSFIP